MGVTPAPQVMSDVQRSALLAALQKNPMNFSTQAPSNASTQTVKNMAPINAAVSNGVPAPAQGYGGINYNTTNAAGRAAISANEAKLNGDPNFVQSELTRTNNVISGMAPGADNSAQLAYKAKLEGLTPPPKQSDTGNVVKSDVVPSYSAPLSTGTSTPSPYGQLTPAQLQTEVQSRINQLLAGGRNAYQTALTGAKNAYDYTTQNTQRARTLRDAMFHEQNNPFSGKYQYDKTNMADSDNIADTAANADYNNKVGSINQTWADLQSAAPDQAQALYDQLVRQERDYGLQEGTLTGQFNGSPTLAATTANNQYQLGLAGLSGQLPASAGGGQTLAAQNQNFDQNLQTNQFNQQAQNQQFNQNLDTQKLQQAGQQFAAQNKLDWTKLSLDQQNALSQIAISQQNANTSAASQANTAANDAARLKLDQNTQDLANANAYGTKNAAGQQSEDFLYKQSQAARDSALATKAGQDSQKAEIDAAYKDAVAMAQKDTLFSTYDPAKQAAIIDGYYQHLKPATPSDAAISAYLNK